MLIFRQTLILKSDFWVITNRYRVQSTIIGHLSNALCGYPIVNIELDIQARFPPQHSFSCCLIISDRNIWRLPAAQFHFWIIFGYELNTVYCSSQIYKKSIAVQVVYSSKVLVHCLLGGRELGGGCLEVPGILSKVGIPIRHTLVTWNSSSNRCSTVRTTNSKQTTK